jgi:hypothetical protein
MGPVRGFRLLTFNSLKSNGTERALEGVRLGWERANQDNMS